MDKREEAFRRYMEDQFQEVLDMLVPKARIYGTAELGFHGSMLSRADAGEFMDPYSAPAQMKSVAAYAAGKMARWVAASHRGEQPTRDTVLDLMVYCLMWLKLDETGEWWVSDLNTDAPEDPEIPEWVQEGLRDD